MSSRKSSVKKIQVDTQYTLFKTCPFAAESLCYLYLLLLAYLICCLSPQCRVPLFQVSPSLHNFVMLYKVKLSCFALEQKKKLFAFW